MARTGLLLGLIFAVVIGWAACSRAADERVDQDDSTAAGDEITVTGCLNAAPDRAAFVVTAARDALTSDAIYSGAGGTPTFTYELTGNTGDLTAHVGRQVAVTGRLDDDREDEVEVDDEQKTELPKVQSGDRAVEPAIETETEMAINVRRLAVAKVEPTGQACGTGGQPEP